jgi:hypothetical protein
LHREGTFLLLTKESVDLSVCRIGILLIARKFDLLLAYIKGLKIIRQYYAAKNKKSSSKVMICYPCFQ